MYKRQLDTSNENGVLMQDMQLLFARWDNSQRKQNAVAGMKMKMSKGEWIVKPPQGYDIVRRNGERKIIVNSEGKLLSKAFQWKSEGMNNEKILQKLHTLGLPIYKQQLSKVLANPFYCGIMVHGLLDGKVVEGKHEKMITKEMFLKVNHERLKSPLFGLIHSRDNEALPLRKFVRCGTCNEPFTGYLVKKKHIWYYKCRTTGCRCNKNAGKLHEAFEELLSDYTIDSKLMKPIQYHLEYLINRDTKDDAVHLKVCRSRLSVISNNLEKLAERFYICLLYTSDAADERSSVDLGGRRIIKKKKQ